MALQESDYKKIIEELDMCKRPLFFFHDDPDGLASFLLLYRYKKEGHGTIVKTSPRIDDKFLRKVEEYQPDKIFVVDIAMIEQEFIDTVKVPIVWIDHHEPQDRDRIMYFNPRVEKRTDNLPASYLCYKAVNQDMWVAAVGCIGDWFFPPFADELRKKHPGLLPEDITKPEDALFNSPLGKLVIYLSHIIKGKTSDVMKAVKILTRIKDPNEILEGTTPQGLFLKKRAEKIEQDYQEILKHALSKVDAEDKFLIYIYKDDKMSFTKELANELLYRYPKKKIIVGRERNDEVKCSIRGTGLNLPSIVQAALVGVEGYGGGHEYACGVCVKKGDFDRFVDEFKKEINTSHA